MFDKKTPSWVVERISDLLKFDPGLRLTSRQCLAREREVLGGVCVGKAALR